MHVFDFCQGVWSMVDHACSECACLVWLKIHAHSVDFSRQPHCWEATCACSGACCAPGHAFLNLEEQGSKLTLGTLPCPCRLPGLADVLNGCLYVSSVSDWFLEEESYGVLQQHTSGYVKKVWSQASCNLLCLSALAILGCIEGTWAVCRND